MNKITIWHGSDKIIKNRYWAKEKYIMITVVDFIVLKV